MSEIPNSWVAADLGDLISLEMGQAPAGSDCNKDGVGTPFVKAGEFGPTRPVIREWTTAPLRFGKNGDVFLCVVGATSGKINFGVDCAIGRSVAALRPGEALTTEYLYHFLSTKVMELRTGSTGSAQGVISKPGINSIPIPLPSLNEQKRIVAKIEELFSELEAGEESLRVARRQLGVYRQSLLKQAFEGRLTAKWRTQNPAQLESPAQFLARIHSARQARYEQQLNEWQAAMAAWEKCDQSTSKPRRPSTLDDIEQLPSEILNDLADLPSSWFWGRLGSMTLGVEYGTAAKSSEAGECPVIRMGNLQGGEIDWDDLVFTSDETEITQYRLTAGDVLFNRTNSPELVGKTAIYRGNRPAVFAGYLIRVNQIADVVCSGYLNYFLNSGVAREYGNSVKTDGVNQSNINGAKLAGYPFPYCSLPEQQEIVRLLDEQFEVIERNEREIDAALKRSAALRQAILKKAFTGRLVPQVATDEPASQLLAHLRSKSGPQMTDEYRIECPQPRPPQERSPRRSRTVTARPPGD